MNVFRRKIIQPLIDLLKQGITPQKLALSVSLGIVLGVFPVIGSTTLLCAAAGFCFKLNQPAIQLVNYVVYPLQFLCLIPLYRAGEWLFRAPRLSISAQQVKTWATSDPMSAIRALWTTTWHAMIAWCFIAPVVAGLVYVGVLPLLKRFQDGRIGVEKA